MSSAGVFRCYLHQRDSGEHADTFSRAGGTRILTWLAVGSARSWEPRSEQLELSRMKCSALSLAVQPKVQNSGRGEAAGTMELGPHRATVPHTSSSSSLSGGASCVLYLDEAGDADCQPPYEGIGRGRSGDWPLAEDVWLDNASRPSNAEWLQLAKISP
jgi:hypothetical protein